MPTFIEMASSQEAISRMKAEKRKKMFQERWDQSGIPTNLENFNLEAAFSRYIDETNLERLNAWISSPNYKNHSLCVAGSVAHSKSKIAVWALRKRISQNKNSPSLGYLAISEIHANYGMATDHLVSPDYLIVDGLHADPLHIQANASLRRLLDKRAQEQKITIATTTLAVSDFKAIYGESVYGLIYEKTIVVKTTQVSKTPLSTSALFER